LFFCDPERLKKTVDIESSTVEIEERGVKLKLTVVDTPGFGDSLDNSEWYNRHLKFLTTL
jgi:septin family protein